MKIYKKLGFDMKKNMGCGNRSARPISEQLFSFVDVFMPPVYLNLSAYLVPNIHYIKLKHYLIYIGICQANDHLKHRISHAA